MRKLLHKAGRAFKDRRGISYVKAAVLVMAFAMLAAVVMFYVNTMALIRYTRNNIEIVLDSFLVKNSIAIYDSIKQGNSDTVRRELVENTDFDTMFANQFGACVVEGDSIVKYEEGGGTKETYRITMPEVSLTDSNLKLKADYVIRVPVTFAGVTLFTLDTPITVESNYVAKFE